MSKVIIAPSILSANFAFLADDIKKVEQAGADWVHVDVMDGHFVPNLTIGACVVRDIKKTTKLPLDVHLMIENPEKYLDDFIHAGSDIITFHYEATKNCEKLIDKIHSHKLLAGVSIKPKTKVSEIMNLLDKADLILVMTVEPGFGGQKFMEDCAEKVKKIREFAPKKLIIEVDGGINDKTAKTCKDYGVNALVAGNYIYKSEDIKKAVQSLR